MKLLNILLLTVLIQYLGINNSFSDISISESVGKEINANIKFQKKEFELGKPIQPDLVMTLVGNPNQKSYYQMVTINMKLTGPDGKEVPFIGKSYKNVYGSVTLHPGITTVIDFNQMDISKYCHISKPGRYTIQFTGNNKGYPSIQLGEPITIEIQPGTLTDKDIVIDYVLSILPENWHLLPPSNKIRQRHPLLDGKTQSYSLFLQAPGHEDTREKGIEIVVSEQTFVWLYTYLGKSPWGNIYLNIPEEYQSLWPDIEIQIRKVLKVRDWKEI
jgi:hypothetical protein